ncbi:MAG: hypothetical protein NC095_04260 [Muribaculum sp.]|nr:hypothetical protein [Muribaculum sp.]
MKRHSNLNEKTFRNNFFKEVDWFGINEEIAIRELPDASHRIIAVDPEHINKVGKCTITPQSSGQCRVRAHLLSLVHKSIRAFYLLSDPSCFNSQIG